MVWGIGETVTGVASGVRSQKEQQAMDNRAKMMLTPLNFGTADLRAIFGGKPVSDARNANDVFGTGLQDAIRAYMKPTTFGAGGPNILQTIVGDPALYAQNYQKSLGYLDQAVGTAAEANQTGLKTNGDAYFNEAIRQYMEKALPAAAETAGLGVTSSGFQAAASKASQDLLGQASLANIDLSEAAANRRLQAAPLLQGLTAARQQLPLNLASDLTGLFNFEARKPLDTFAQLYTLGGNNYSAPSYNPTNTGAATTAAILQGLSGLGAGLGAIIKSAGSDNTGGGSIGGNYDFGYNQNTGYDNLTSGNSPLYSGNWNF